MKPRSDRERELLFRNWSSYSGFIKKFSNAISGVSSGDL